MVHVQMFQRKFCCQIFRSSQRQGSAHSSKVRTFMQIVKACGNSFSLLLLLVHTNHEKNSEELTKNEKLNARLWYEQQKLNALTLSVNIC